MLGITARNAMGSVPHGVDEACACDGQPDHIPFSRCTTLPSIPVLALNRDHGVGGVTKPASSAAATTVSTRRESATQEEEEGEENNNNNNNNNNEDDVVNSEAGQMAARSSRSMHVVGSDVASAESTASLLCVGSDGTAAQTALGCTWHKAYYRNDAGDNTAALGGDAAAGGAEGGDCECPMCQLGSYIYYLFANQRRASAHVMAARPSPPPCAGGASALLPPLPPVPTPSPRLTHCPVYATFGFCPYSAGCYLPHRRDRPPLARRLRRAEDELQRLQALATRRLDEPLWRCEVCGAEGIDDASLEAVGELYFYRHCPRCSFMCYFPFITYLLEAILDGVGDDYQLYKSEVDHYRRALPDEFKVPLTFEAHRIASIVFAWSLVSPPDARDALEAAYRVLPQMESIVSIGSGAGYVEHVFNRVLNGDDVTLRPEWQISGGHATRSSFDAVHVRFRPRRRIDVFAFDELALSHTYSVHVSLGGPLSLLSFDCRRVALLLCWPPFGSMQEEQSSMGFEALEYFTQRGGTVVIYIGDTASTGDWRFHQLLFTHYKLVRDYPVRRELRRWYPQEMGLVFAGNDTIGVYLRREAPIALRGGDLTR